MQLCIAPDKEFQNKVPYRSIHGKYPYKLYLEVKGNCKYGRFIVVVDDKPFADVDSILVKDASQQSQNDNGPKREKFVYNVRKVDIFEIGDNLITVFRLTKK